MIKASSSKQGLAIMWLSSALQLARGFSFIRSSRLPLGALEATSTKALFSLASRNHVLSSIDDVPNMLGSALAEGGTDSAAQFLAAASLEEPDSSVTVPILDKLSAASWVHVVQKTSGLDKSNGSGAGKASSCFNVLLSELGRSPDPGTSSGHEESIPGSRAELAVAVLDKMRDPRNGCLPDVVAFSAAASACVAAGNHDKAKEILSLASAASGRRPGEKRVRVRRQSSSGSKNEIVHGERVTLDEGVQIEYEDDHLVVAYKPPGLLVHRVEGTPAKEKSLCEIMASSGRPLSSLGPSHAAGVTHRLDKGTSGLIILAKTNLAHAELVMTFFRRLVSKSYLALTTVAQAISDDRETTKGRIDLPLDGRPAISEWELMGTLYGNEAATPIASLVKVKTLTGRKHQVRRHLAQGLGSHILLDPLYGKGSRGRKKNGRSDDEWTDEAIVDHVSGIATGGLESPPKSKKSNAASALARSGVFFLHAQSLRLPHPVVRGKELIFDVNPVGNAWQAALE